MPSVKRSQSTTPARVIVRDACREIRARFRASRSYVTPYLDDIVGGRRGLKTADQLAHLAGDMLSGGYTADEASAALARMGRRIVQAEAQKRAI